MIEKRCGTCVHYNSDDGGFCGIGIGATMPFWVWNLIDDPYVRDVDPEDGWDCDTWQTIEDDD